MAYPTEQMRQLLQLEDVFALAADQPYEFGRATEMLRALDRMETVLEEAQEKNPGLSGDVADYILDFLTRDDLSGQHIERAFDETRGVSPLKLKVSRKMAEMEESILENQEPLEFRI